VDGVLVIIIVAVFNGHGWLLAFVGFDFKFLVKERKMGKPSPHRRCATDRTWIRHRFYVCSWAIHREGGLFLQTLWCLSHWELRDTSLKFLGKVIEKSDPLVEEGLYIAPNVGPNVSCMGQSCHPIMEDCQGWAVGAYHPGSNLSAIQG
jgi:hypothetical protein